MRYRWLVAGFVVFAAGSVVVSLFGARPRAQPKLIAKVGFDALKLSVSSPVPGELTFRASFDHTNPFRDAFYTYAVRVFQVGGVTAFEHVYEERLQGAVKDKPLSVSLDLQRLTLPPGTYKVYAEVREDAREVDRNGDLLSPYHVIGGNTSAPVQVK